MAVFFRDLNVTELQERLEWTRQHLAILESAIESCDGEQRLEAEYLYSEETLNEHALLTALDEKRWLLGEGFPEPTPLEILEADFYGE